MIPLHLLAEKADLVPEADVNEYKCTISAAAQPLFLFARQLSLMADVSIVVASELENALVTVDFVEQDISDVVEAVARRSGTDFTRNGDLFFIGSLRPEDRGVFVTSLGHIPPDDFRRVAELLSTETGRTHVTDTGVGVVSDKVSVLARVADAVRQLEAVERSAWLLQFHIVETSARQLESVGIESVASVGAEVTTSGSTAFARVSAALSNVRDASSSSIVAEPVYLVNDSEVVRYERGQEFPVTSTTTTPDGLQTTDVDYQSVGSTIEAVVRSLGGDSAVLTVDISDQSLTDETVSGLPIINGYQFSDTVDIRSGGTYLLSTFNRYSDSTGTRLGWSKLFDTGSDSLVSQIWVRAYKVGASGVENDAIHVIVTEGESERQSGLSGGATDSPYWPFTAD